MSLADEITRLQALRDSGVLSEEEFQRAKGQVLDGRHPVPPVAAVNQLRRSRSDRWIGGVCGGIAVISGIDSWVWRLIFTLLFFFGGTGLLIYLLLWIFVPNE